MLSYLPHCAALALACLAGCTDMSAAQVGRMVQTAPPGAEPGTCWGQDVTPAIIQTVTHQVVVTPEQQDADGTVIQPAVYQTETRQDILRERSNIWFQTPCPEDMNPQFVASLQRALHARGLYRGPINGEMTRKTQTAIRQFQEAQGIESTQLSLVAARKLGLVAIERRDES